FGWWMLFTDVNKTDGGVFRVLKDIQHSYTILPDVSQGWRWGNAVTSLLVPQRGFLLGIPLAVIVITQWWTAAGDAETRGRGDTEKKSSKKMSKSELTKIEANLRVSASPHLRVSPRMLAA